MKNTIPKAKGPSERVSKYMKGHTGKLHTLVHLSVQHLTS